MSSHERHRSSKHEEPNSTMKIKGFPEFQGYEGARIPGYKFPEDVRYFILVKVEDVFVNLRYKLEATKTA
jgi:hypothetical protein